MTLSELERLVSHGESDEIEFKTSTGQLARAGESLCAFMNGHGGWVLIGVKSNGQIVGQIVSDSTQQDLANIFAKFEPPCPVEIERVAISGGSHEVLVLRVQANAESLPFTYDGRSYQRIGTTTSVMPQETYQRLLVERLHAKVRWENRSAEIRIEDLDTEEIRRMVRSGVDAGRVSAEVSFQDMNDLVERLNLRANGSLLNAAMVVFGREFLPYFPQCQLRMAYFRGIDKSEFIDQSQVSGNIYQLLKYAMDFIRRHVPVAGRIEPGLFERVDEPLYPPVALREALVNAFCHRDYSIAGGAVDLAIYDNRLEIRSPGRLPQGVTLESLKLEHQSRPRNPLIAGILYMSGLVERWGRGTQKIIELCVRAGHPEPEFLESGDSVIVRFIPSGYVAPLRVAHDLTERQRRILLALAEGRDLQFREIRAQVDPNLAIRTLRDDLTHLSRLGLIRSRGHGRGAFWSQLRDNEPTGE